MLTQSLSHTNSNYDETRVSAYWWQNALIMLNNAVRKLDTWYAHNLNSLWNKFSKIHWQLNNSYFFGRMMVKFRRFYSTKLFLFVFSSLLAHKQKKWVIQWSRNLTSEWNSNEKYPFCDWLRNFQRKSTSCYQSRDSKIDRIADKKNFYPSILTPLPFCVHAFLISCVFLFLLALILNDLKR